MGERGKYDRSLSATARKKQQKREIVLAATGVFSKLGISGASAEEIVQAAGMSRRTFYQHFDDLQDVLAAVHEAAGKFAMNAVDEAIASSGEPLLQVEAGIRALLSLISQNSGLARVLFGDLPWRVESRQAKQRAHFAAVLEHVLLEAHERGGLARAPDSVALLAIVAGIEAVGTKMASPGGPDLEEATEAMVRLTRGAFN